MSVKSVEEQQKAAVRRAELEELKPISFKEMTDKFNEWMLMPDKYFLKYIMSCYCANELSQRPVWSIIIAPSGGGKTEMLNSLLPLEKIFQLSTITPSTFLSGMTGDRDQSLLPKIDGKILLIKDWTIILSLQRDTQAEIFGQFRDIHDGSMVKIFGNGQERNWNGKVSILAACTEAIDTNQQQYTHLGERFVYYRPVMPDRREVAFRSLQNAAKQEEMKKALQNAVFAFIKGIDFTKYETLPELPDTVQGELVELAEFATKARSGIVRDFGFKKEVLFVPTPEMPTRVLQQISLIGQGAMIINNGKLLEGDIKMMYKTMLDSVPRTNIMVIREMARGPYQTTAQIASSLGYPTDTIRTYLENQALLGVCVRDKHSGKGDKWTIDEAYAKIIRQYYNVNLLPTPEEVAEQEQEQVSNVEEVFGVNLPYKDDSNTKPMM